MARDLRLYLSLSVASMICCTAIGGQVLAQDTIIAIAVCSNYNPEKGRTSRGVAKGSNLVQTHARASSECVTDGGNGACCQIRAGVIFPSDDRCVAVYSAVDTQDRSVVQFFEGTGDSREDAIASAQGQCEELVESQSSLMPQNRFSTRTRNRTADILVHTQGTGFDNGIIELEQPPFEAPSVEPVPPDEPVVVPLSCIFSGGDCANNN